MKMKSLFVSLLLSLMIGSCSEKEKETVLEVVPGSLEFVKEALTKSASVRTNAAEWTATVDPAGREWCSTTASGDVLRVTVSANAGNGMRKTSVEVSAGGLSRNIEVRQLGADPAILVSSPPGTVPAKGGRATLSVTANVEYIVKGLPDWVKEVADDASRAGGMVEFTHTFSVDENPGGSRSAIITFQGIEAVSGAQATILQEPGIYEVAESGLKDDIKVTVLRGEASASQSGEGIELSYDGDLSTWYHSPWGGTAFPVRLDYYLNNAEMLDYVVYSPRSGHTNGNFKEVDIFVKYKGAAGFDLLLQKDFGGSHLATRVDFVPALRNVDAIRFSVKSGVSDAAYDFASCAEMEFYRKNPDGFDPLELFADAACTELRAGITEAEIDACTYPLFRRIATNLLKGNYPAEFRIAEYKAYPHPDDESRTNKTSTYSLLDNPTGIAVKAKEELIVMVGETGGGKVGLRIQDLNEPNGNGFYTAVTYTLMQGINKIIPSKGGLLYVMYHTPDFRTAPAVKIHIPSGKVNGYFDSTIHTDADWTRLLAGASHDYFDVLGKYAHLTFPTSRFRNHTGNRGRELIDAYDRIVYLEMEHMGLEKYERMFNNRMYFSVMYTSYMYATSYHTAYNDGTLAELCNPALLKTSAIWGPAHEAGHINQTRPGLRWIGMTEVTNNIHAMYVQRAFQNDSRLQTESMSGEGGYTNRYEKAMNLYFRSGRPHCYMMTAAESNLVDVFCKLVPLWQLHLYLVDARGKTDFYRDLYEMVRNEPDMTTNAGHQLEFVVRACKAAELDLTAFFEKWGFLTEVDVEVGDYGSGRMNVTKTMIDQIKTRIKELGYSEPPHRFEYICDKNADMFKSAAPITTGRAVRSGKKVTLTGWSNAAAFEVRKDGKLIFVTTEPASFTLDNTIAAWDDGYKVYAVSSTGEEVEVAF